MGCDVMSEGHKKGYFCDAFIKRFFLSSIVTCEFNKLLFVLCDQKVERAQGNT